MVNAVPGRRWGPKTRRAAEDARCPMAAARFCQSPPEASWGRRRYYTRARAYTAAAASKHFWQKQLRIFSMDFAQLPRTF